MIEYIFTLKRLTHTVLNQLKFYRMTLQKYTAQCANCVNMNAQITVNPKTLPLLRKNFKEECRFVCGFVYVWLLIRTATPYGAKFESRRCLVFKPIISHLWAYTRN